MLLEHEFPVLEGEATALLEAALWPFIHTGICKMLAGILSIPKLLTNAFKMGLFSAYMLNGST